MTFYPINLLYFVITLPILVIALYLVSKLYLKENINHLVIILSLSLLLFLIRFILTIFGATIGIMPYLVEDVVFYSLLLLFGMIFTYYFLYRIEKSSFKEIGFKSDDLKKSILYGLIGIIPLMLFTPLIILLTNISISPIPSISLEKLIITLSFSILGAIYEETMFRGIIQKHITNLTKENTKIIIYTATIFTLTHLFYLPFTGFGIYYIFVFIMALLLSWFRIKFDLITCAILHGGIVFLLIILV